MSDPGQIRADDSPGLSRRGAAEAGDDPASSARGGAEFPVPSELSLEVAQAGGLLPAKLTAFAPAMVWMELALEVPLTKGDEVRVVFREDGGSCLGMRATVVWAATGGRVAVSVRSDVDRTVLAQWALGQPADLSVLMRLRPVPASPEGGGGRRRSEQEDEASYTGALDHPWNRLLSMPRLVPLPPPYWASPAPLLVGADDLIAAGWTLVTSTTALGFLFPRVAVSAASGAALAPPVSAASRAALAWRAGLGSSRGCDAAETFGRTWAWSAVFGGVGRALG